MVKTLIQVKLDDVVEYDYTMTCIAINICFIS